MKKRLLPLILTLTLLLSACGGGEEAVSKRYEASFLSLFDTVTLLEGFAESEEAFRATAQSIHDKLLEYHQLYDIYNDYPGLNNLKTINDNAGKAPVEVDRRIIDLLLFARDCYEETGGTVNVAMGSLLSLWHDAREAGIDDPESAALPDPVALSRAAEHMDFSTVMIDEEASTIFLSDPDQRLDVGAVAKGYATERVCQEAPAGLLVSVGGNVCPTGPRPDGSGPWAVAVQDPDGGRNDTLLTLSVEDVSVVSSGDYQRYFTVDGKRYHHIIDPATGYPADRYRAVTILCPDSGVADALSTALFLLPQSEGEALLKRFDAQALWVSPEGGLTYSDGFSDYLRE